MRDQWATKLSFYHLQLNIFNENWVICVEEEKFRLPVAVRGSKTSVLKLSTAERAVIKSNRLDNIVGTWKEPPNSWLRVAKNAFVGWASNF